MTQRQTLLEPVHTLLQALTKSPSSPSSILKTFTTNPLPLVHEHGLPQLAPFLGRSFTGQDGVARYFQLLADTLEIRDMAFEPEELWLVDESAMAVVLRGSATFVWKKTNQAWDETFVYRVALAREVRGKDSNGAGGDADLGGVGVGADGGEGLGLGPLNVCEYRVWADTGAAYLARLGRLGELLVDGCVDGSGRGGYEGIHVHASGTEREEKVDGDGDGKAGSGETRRSVSRKRSGGQDVLGGGLNVYGSCG